MITVSELEDYWRVDYESKDVMHGIHHIRRLYHDSIEMVQRIGCIANLDVIMVGAYLHGVIYRKEKESAQLLRNRGLPGNLIDHCIKAAWESQSPADSASTIEGKVLHDAHLLEGGKSFFVTKTLVTGALRGGTVEDSIEFLENNIIDKLKVTLPENVALLSDKMDYAKEYVSLFWSGMGKANKSLKGTPLRGPTYLRR